MEKQSLISHLIKIINGSRKDTAILGGHFAICTDDAGETFPAIYQDIDSASLRNGTSTRKSFQKHPYSGEFPVETFDAAIQLAVQATVPLSVPLLVNDWQFVQKAHDGNAPNLFRESFYEQNELPPSFMHVLQKHEKCDAVFLPNTDKKLTYKKAHWYFSEQKLRNRFSGWVQYQSCSLQGGDCAKEFVPFLEHVIKYANLFVCFIPGTCKNAINEATRYVRNEIGLDIEIHTVAIYNTVDLHQFWETSEYYVNGEMEIIS